MSNIRLEGYDDLLQRIKTVAQLKGIAKATRAAALHVKGKIATYPAERHGTQPFKTDKSRRFFFWALRNGKIEVPYRRGSSPGSERLSAKWTVQPQAQGLVQVVGNNASYAQLVQGPQNQTAYHADTGWPTTEKVIEQERSTVIQYLVQAIERLLAQ